MGAKLDLLMRFMQQFQDGDWEGACRTYIAEDFQCVEPPALPQGGVFHGWDAPMVISNIYREIWDVEVLDYHFWDDEDGDVVTGRYVIKWTDRQTGKSMTQPVAELNTISDGKIRKMEVFHFDVQGLLATRTA